MNIFEIIDSYSTIYIYRHVNPDYDAYGSQLAMAYIIKQYDPTKKVVLKGENNEELLNKFIYSDLFDEDLHQLGLAIVIDTANKERIDGELMEENPILKIDHHEVVESYGKWNIEIPTKSSASQIVCELYQESGLKLMNLQAATCLYYGIIGDSNRFMYRNSDASTFKAAAYLLECGVQIEQVYQSMYLKKEKDLEIQRHILNHYQVKGKVAYYILMQEDLDQLQISRSKGSDYVNLLANIDEFEVWMAITQNSEANNYRVSIRSRSTIINDVAMKFNGGGHQLASGVTLQSLDQLDDLIQEILRKIRL